MNTTLVVVIVVIAVAVGAGVMWYFMRQRRAANLRGQFGPEYDRAVRQYGGEDKAQAELESRERRVNGLNIRPLNASEQTDFAGRWRATQAHFVDDPAAAIGEADALVIELMRTRGYPVGDFEQRAADVSVDHPNVVQHYRAAHRIAERRDGGEIKTEDLRQAMVHYRALFDDLLESGAPTQSQPKYRRIA